ncbi:TraB/GumN family protein [Caulobacter sp. SL161]|uniref:TraB/GumN family protein n=1 Tax=Caulobacter sp. SL161 TaxID=2995156 RepID=UPI00227585D9|nr:TraB/GumN family protein [Caulobacter sp. SL161]MCY1646727.1 TraB/GumN family protein [Caulobacter sp. SL161]
MTLVRFRAPSRNRKIVTLTRFAAAGLALSLLCGGSALAQVQGKNEVSIHQTKPVDLTPVDSQANLVEELIVNARLPGPAWWKVSDGDTNVYVMGVPAFAPQKLDFDDSVLRRRLDGANVLIMGQEPEVRLLSLLALIPGRGKQFITDKPMRDTLPPDLRARLEKHLTARSKPVSEHDQIKPALAGFIIANDKGGGVSITIGDLTDRIQKLAKSKDIAVQPRIKKLDDYDLIGMVKSLGEAPQPLQELCLDAGLKEVENGLAGLRETADQWAEGQVRAVVSAERGYQRCLASTPWIARQFKDGQDEAVGAITQALKKPGKAVAVIELRALLTQDGVLDRLRAKGFTVTAPE